MWTPEQEEEYQRELRANADRDLVAGDWDWRRKVKDESGSEERFRARIDVYDSRRMPRVSHHFWWFVHNCVAHPLIGVLPIRSTFLFHDYTSRKINAE